jgi:hypothetical protein
MKAAAATAVKFVASKQATEFFAADTAVATDEDSRR